MKLSIAVILAILFGLFITKAWSFHSRENALSAQLSQIETQYKSTEEDYRNLQADYEYYKNPENLEKELRARFNYRSPDEKMIIIVPPVATSTSSTRP